ncbi:CLUMA_CG007255, isoform A, partial [Clunio marinus]
IFYALLVNILFVLVTSGFTKVNTNVVHKVADGVQGTWKKKWTWKQHWVKTWKPVYVAKWTKVWSPAEVREYVPLPPVPPNWLKPVNHH